MMINRAVIRRGRTARITRVNDEVAGYLLPIGHAKAAQLRAEERLRQAAQARRIAEARARTDRRGLRAMWRRRIVA